MARVWFLFATGTVSGRFSTFSRSIESTGCDEWLVDDGGDSGEALNIDAGEILDGDVGEMLGNWEVLSSTDILEQFVFKRCKRTFFFWGDAK